MLKAQEFLELRRLEEKLERREALSPEEQALLKKHHISGPRVCGYNGCTNRLGPRVDGEHRKIDNAEVCEECYFDELGDQLEMFPIGVGVRRAHGCGHIE
jgi:hypothetical protein